MQAMRQMMLRCLTLLLLALASVAAAQDANITQPVADLEQLLAAEPLLITQAQISRPTAKGDITLRAEVSLGGAPPLRVKLRHAERGADSFNNVPRYDLAAYELQKLFLDPGEYVVPPTALRMVPLADFAKYSPNVVATFAGADQVLAVVQYWLQDVKAPADIYRAERFAVDSAYARHIGQLNLLTYLIRHGDSNLGNFLIGAQAAGARVFSIDHGIAFASEGSDRGELWKEMRVNRLPADALERLRKVTLPMLTDHLGVLVQWRLEGGRYVAAPLGKNLATNSGVRRAGDALQMGLTQSEISALHRRLQKLLARVDSGELALVVSAAAAPVAATPSAQLQWSGIERVFAFADVHGAYSELATLLREAGILDAQQHWAAGHTHVVSLGDLLDRGAESRKVMDLLMRLQAEAHVAGGQLHVLLGNHEAMNMLGDLRYVAAGEYASYQDMEPAVERAQRRLTWEAEHGAGSAAAFDQKFPLGYFGHRAAFSPNGKYGQWLLTLPVAVMINDTLFMHAGPSTLLRGMSLAELNLRYRTALTDYLGLAERLERAKLLQLGDEFDVRPQLAKDRLAAATAANASTIDAALTEATQRFEVAANSPLLADGGPNWYRGAALCNEAAEADVLLPSLQQFGAARLVVGHTPTRGSRATTRFDGRVVKLDAGMNHAAYNGRAAALLLEPRGLSVRYAGEPNDSPPQPEGLVVAPKEVDDANVLAALRDGDVVVTGPLGPNELSVAVNYRGTGIPAVFRVRADDAARKEVAAYRLDRQLRLGIVPVTVQREVQSQRGILQARPRKWISQAEVQRQSLRVGGWCSVEPQFQLVYAFDTLIGNESRTAESLLFDSDGWVVYATSYERAFGTAAGLPAYLKARPPTPGAEVRRRLEQLDEAGLQAALGDLLDARARKAILARRNVLLALPAAATAVN